MESEQENENISAEDKNDDKTMKDINPINEIKIRGYTYKYKDTYKSGICYRCQHRYSCKLTILISFDEYEKLKKGIDNTEIKITVNSKQKEHKCVMDKTEVIGLNEIKTKEEEKQLAILLIKANLMEPPSFHFNNLINNKIRWPKKKVENLVYKLQEEKFPNYNTFIKTISNIDIILDGNDNISDKYKLCPRQCIFRIPKKNKDEYLIFFTTPFQLNLLKETDILFLDGTFRSCPKSFYQIFNIIAHLKNKNLSLPIMSVLMKNKFDISYYNVFENFKIMLKEYNINIDITKMYFMADFEAALRKSLEICFPNSIILGCYFHYLKCIVNKFKIFGMLNKKTLLKSYKLIYFFKLYPFLLNNDKEEFLKYMIEKYINEYTNDDEYNKIVKLFIYFIKTWYGTKIIDYIEEADSIFNYRTNNTVERFNLNLNKIVNHRHPKLSFFCEKYKIIIQNAYQTYINNLKDIDDNIEEPINNYITTDIYNFILKLISKYKSSLSYKIISEINEDDENDLKKFLFKILDLLYGIKNEEYLDDSKNEDLSDSDSSIYLSDDENIFNERENFSLNNEETKKKLLSKLNDMCKIYYAKNNVNIFNDTNIEKIPKKRKSEFISNKYASFLDDILSKKEDKKINEKVKKKYS